jgi:hypothetical protein
MAINARVAVHSLSSNQSLSLSLSKLSLFQRMTSNNSGKLKLEEEAKSSMVRKRLWFFDTDGDDDDSSDYLKEETKEEEETAEEVSSEKLSMNQLDTSDEKLLAKHGCDIIFCDDGDTTSPSSEPCTLESRVCFDPDSSDEDDDDDDI